MYSIASCHVGLFSDLLLTCYMLCVNFFLVLLQKRFELLLMLEVVQVVTLNIAMLYAIIIKLQYAFTSSSDTPRLSDTSATAADDDALLEHSIFDVPQLHRLVQTMLRLSRGTHLSDF